MNLQNVSALNFLNAVTISFSLTIRPSRVLFVHTDRHSGFQAAYLSIVKSFELIIL